MKLKKLLIGAVLMGIAFTSCRDNDRGVDDENRVEMERAESEREADLRANQQQLDDENSVTARIERNRNLSTFNEGMNRTQISQNLNRNRTTGTNATGTTGTGTTGQTGTTTGNNTGTTTGQTGTTGQNTGTRAGQGQTTAQVSYTIFAPSNDAYAGLTETQRNEMMDTQNRDRNTASMNYLMVEQRLTEEQLRQQIQNSNGTYNIKTMQGENITATLDGENIVLRDAQGNQARIVETDTEASDGVIFVIDKVLMPKDPTRNEATNRTGTNTGNNTGTTGTTDRNTGTGNQ